MLEDPANELVAGGEIVIGDGELAAVGVFIVEPGIDHGVDGALAEFGSRHENIAVFGEHSMSRAGNGDGAHVLDEDRMRVVEDGAFAVDDNPALVPVGADDVLAKNTVEVDA